MIFGPQDHYGLLFVLKLDEQLKIRVSITHRDTSDQGWYLFLLLGFMLEGV